MMLADASKATPMCFSITLLNIDSAIIFDHEQGGELYESDALSKTRGGVVFTLALPAICASFFD